MCIYLEDIVKNKIYVYTFSIKKIKKKENSNHTIFHLDMHSYLCTTNLGKNLIYDHGYVLI